MGVRLRRSHLVGQHCRALSVMRRVPQLITRLTR
jgi:hypothetical protein